jgi:hypothetical protein
VKAQIDNSIGLGWKKEDIMLVTNFEYAYKRVRAVVLGDDAFCYYCPIATKTTVIAKLFDLGMIKNGEMYWVHDLDAFQLEVIKESDVMLDGTDMAMCDYGRMPMWSGGSIFFKESAEDIFKRTKEFMDKYRMVDDRALWKLTEIDELLKRRIKKLNVTYNFQPYNIRPCWKHAIKPLKVAHFNPFGGVRQLGVTNALEFYKGKNKMNKPFITERVVKILEHNKVDIL